MTTIEMRNGPEGRFGNGLIARGYLRQPAVCAALPETTLRGWSFGLGRGLTGSRVQGSWLRLAVMAGGVQ
ncbi:MAG: hypothetical protein H7838_13025 [Magnetococcus sp. DMHC-8]